MEPITPYGVIIPSDVDEAISGIAGIYSSAQLYERYCGVVARTPGRRPASKKAFGLALNRRKVKLIKVHGTRARLV